MPDHTDAEELVARVIGEHIDMIIKVGDGYRRTCTCDGWSQPLDTPYVSDANTAAHRRHRAAMVLAALTGAGLLLPAGGETREEWGVWWHGLTADGIVMSEGQLRSREAAEQRGHERIGDYGIRGFTTVRRTHTQYETGEWSTRWERMGEPIWVVTP